MMMEPDSEKFLSAIVTLMVVAVIFRAVFKRIARKRTKIQKPDKREWDKYK